MGTLLIYVGDEPTNKDVLYRAFPKLSVKDGKVLTLRENMQQKQLTGYVLTNWLDKPYETNAVRLDDEDVQRKARSNGLVLVRRIWLAL